MDISFKLDPETIVGPDTISRAGTICARYGNRILIAADDETEPQSINRLKGILEDSGIDAIVFDGISAETGAEMAENITELCRAARCTAVIGFGGLKTQAIARMTAIIAPGRIRIYDLLDGGKIENPFLPYIAIPTSGADVFMFTGYFAAVDPRDRLVKLLKSPDKLCAAAIIDSGLSYSPSEKHGAAAVFDGLCVSLEAYCSTRANFFSDALLEQAISLYATMLKSGPGGADDASTQACTQAGFLASLGSAVSSPGIGAALSYSISGRFPVKKSLISAVLLPFIMERLVAARPEKMARASALLGEAAEGASVAEAANSAVEGVRRYMAALQVPSQLREFGLSLDRLAAAADAARNLEFTAFTPWTVSAEDVFEILKQAF